MNVAVVTVLVSFFHFLHLLFPALSRRCCNQRDHEKDFFCFSVFYNYLRWCKIFKILDADHLDRGRPGQEI